MPQSTQSRLADDTPIPLARCLTIKANAMQTINVATPEVIRIGSIPNVLDKGAYTICDVVVVPKMEVLVAYLDLFFSGSGHV